MTGVPFKHTNLSTTKLEVYSMYESECAAFEKDVTAVTQYSDFNAPISISKTFWPSIKVQMSWCLVAWKVFSHGGLRDPRKEGRVKRGKL